MRYLILGDSHLGIYGNNEIWHNIVFRLFQEIHDKMARENIHHMIHLGDFFHDRKALNIKSLELSFAIADMFSDCIMTIIVGNHDTFYKNKVDPTSLQIFNKYENIHVIKETTIMNDITLVPWLGKIEKPTKFCMGHLELNGFSMNNSYICSKGGDPTVYKDFEHVMSGHFHTPSSGNNITYIGSPYQQTFHDIDSVRGYYIFDDGDLEFIEFVDSPKFIKIHTKDNDLDESDIKGNVVKLIFDENYGTVKNEEIVSTVSSFKPIRLDIDFSNVSIVDDDMEDLDDGDQDLLDHSDIIESYVKEHVKVPEHMSKERLLNIINLLSS